MNTESDDRQIRNQTVGRWVPAPASPVERVLQLLHALRRVVQLLVPVLQRVLQGRHVQRAVAVQPLQLLELQLRLVGALTLQQRLAAQAALGVGGGDKAGLGEVQNKTFSKCQAALGGE